MPSVSKPSPEDRPRSLRILIANERKDRLERIAQIVTSLRHEVISRELEVSEVAAATEREHPHLAFVGLGVSGEHALELISEIVREGFLPGDRAARGRRRRLGQRGRQARDLCVHHRRPRRGDAECDRHHAAPLRRVLKPRRRVREACGDRAGEGDHDVAGADRREASLRAPALGVAAKRPQLYDVAEALVQSHLLLVKR